MLATRYNQTRTRPVTSPATTRAILLLLAFPATLFAQTPAATSTTPAAVTRKKPRIRAYQPPFNPDVIVLDPAHGGSDNGANLGSAGSEKDFNFAFAGRLRDLLTAQGFSVVLTHTSSDDSISADQRVELANRSRAAACLLIHASNGGQGVHIFTSSLTRPSSADDSHSESYIALWDSAQASSLPRSQQLAGELSTSLNGLKIPLLLASASVSPIDSMFCPAVAIEIAAPRLKGNIASEDYQQHIAQSIVTALSYWRQHAKDQIAGAEAAAAAASGPAPAIPAAAPKPKPKPKPAIINSPDEVPLAPETDQPKPAPIVRRPPPQPTTAPLPVTAPPGVEP